MPITPPPEIDSLPQYPTRGQKRETFTPLANQFVAAQQALVEQVNAGLTWAHGTFTALADAESNATSAAQTATEKASIATTKAGEAAGSALAAHNSKEEARFFAEQVLDELGLPSLEGNIGKVLTAIEEAGVKKIGWEEALPPVASGDVGLALVAKEGGGGQWSAARFSKYEEFTSSGTWVKSPLATWVYVEGIGAGGGGGCHSSFGNEAHGGGGGGWHSQLFRAADLTENISYIIGAGGAGGGPVGGDGINASEYGNHGGDTIFDNFIAKGGRGGSNPDGGFIEQGDGYQSGAGGVYGSTGRSAGRSVRGGGGGGYGRGGSLGGLSALAGRGGKGENSQFTSGEDGQWPGGGGGGSGGGGSSSDLSKPTAKAGDGADGLLRIWQW